MAATSNFLGSALLNGLFRGVSYSFPSNIYIALCTTAAVAADTGTTIKTGALGAGQEVTGGNYSRYQLACNTSNWSAPNVSNLISTTGNLDWAAATWSGTVVGIAICDADFSTGGNMLFFAGLASNITITSGNIFRFATGNLTDQLL